MKSKLLCCMFCVFLFASCKSTPNGKYIVYETQTWNPLGIMGGGEGFDQRSSDRLAEEVKGKSYSLQFDPDYIIVTNLQNEEMVFNKKIQSPSSERADTSYVYNYTLDGQKTSLTLLPSYSKGEYKATMMIEVYARATDSLGNSTQGKCARILARLKQRQVK